MPAIVGAHPRAAPTRQREKRRKSSALRNQQCRYDDAVMERWFWSPKHQRTNRPEFADIAESRLTAIHYVETSSNTDRLHQPLGHLSTTN